ncbi:MAG: hypothetical protein ACK5JT_01940, partial [Hyphomicrobiaceae bacterium]
MTKKELSLTTPWQKLPVVLALLLVALVVPMGSISTPAAAEPRYGISIFGDLKYQPGFKHFDY